MSRHRKLAVTVSLALCWAPFLAHASFIEWRFDFGPTFSQPDISIDGYAIIGFDEQDFRFDPIVRDDIVIVSRLISYLIVETNGETFYGAPDRLDPYFGGVQVGQVPNGEWLAIDADLDNGGQITWDLFGSLGELYPYYGFLGEPTPTGDLPGFQQMVMRDESGNLLYVADVTRWTSVPEPGTLALLGIGLFCMGAARRRRKV